MNNQIDWLLEEQAKGNIKNLRWSIDERGLHYKIEFDTAPVKVVVEPESFLGK